MNFKYFVSLLFSILFTIQGYSQTSYYCDPINGDNNNNGSQESPFSTFGSVNWSSVGLQNNDEIYLLDGDHGTGFIQNLQFANNLLIKSVNHQKAELTKITINNCSNLTIEGVKFDATGGSFDKNDPIITGNESSSYISLNNCLVQSADDSSNWTKADWYSNVASGVQFRGDNITLTNNTFFNLYHAVELRGDYSQMTNNSILNFAADAIRGLGSNSTYENNVIKNCYIDDYAIQHDDAFQAFILPGSGIISNVIFRNNKVILFENPSQFVLDNNLIGTLMQGVIITDGNAEAWIVENNLIVSSQSHGITLYGAQNCRIQNNAVIQTQEISNLTDVPWISVQDQSKSGGRINQNNILRNNISGRFTTWTYGPNTTDENNIDIDQSNINNYDTYFVDYTNGDFHSKETSPAVNAGANTDLYPTDLDGNDRVFNNGIVDASCYEFQGEGEIPPTGEYEITSSGDGNVSNPSDVTTNNPFLTGINSGSPSELTLFVGGRDANHDSNTSSAILPFKLPARGVGKVVTEASLKINIHYVRHWISSNIDLYGLPYQSTNTISSSDHFDQAYSLSNGTDTAIQDDFATRTETLGQDFTPDREVLTNTSGNTALVSYLNAQYDAGASEGDYVFLRLNIDAPINAENPTALPTSASHYFGISDETTGEHAPKLSVSISDILNVADISKDTSSLHIYPNPVTDNYFNVISNILKSDATIEIYTITGSKVYSKKASSNISGEEKISIKLSPGTYIVRLYNNSNIQTQKLIIK